jgi:hypothetical protein
MDEQRDDLRVAVELQALGDAGHDALQDLLAGLATAVIVVARRGIQLGVVGRVGGDQAVARALRQRRVDVAFQPDDVRDAVQRGVEA